MAGRASEHEAAWTQVINDLSRLDGDWTVLAAPRFGLEQTDAVVLHEQHGVVVVVVSWLRPGEAERDVDGLLVDPGQGVRITHQPHLDAERIADHVYDAFYADLDGPNESDGAVRWIVVAPHLDDATARQLLGARGATDLEVAATVFGSGFAGVAEHALAGPAASGTAAGGQPISRAGLRRVLEGAVMASGSAAAAPDAPPPAPVQRALRSLVADPTGSRQRRVRGPGGTGKTFALTARAAALASAGERVLVLSFTTTLADHLTELVRRRCSELGADPRLVTITNFHALCEHTVSVAESIGYRSEWPEGARWPVAIVDRARQVIEQGFDFRYGAILVDEGQDFDVEWWKMLISHYLRPDGEAMVTVDPTEDLYRVEGWFDDEQMTELGFTEPWVDLTDSVRTPPDVIPALEVVGDRPRRIDGSAERDQLLGTAAPTLRRWVDIDRVADLGREIGREVVRLVRDHPTLSPGDVVFLCDYHHDGLAAVREIERAGIPVHHQFSRDPAGRGVRRRRFHVASAAVKGATVHGFKGWEAGALVMGIGADATSPALAAIAIERLATPTAGGSAIITVVNGDRGRRTAASGLGWNDPLATPGPSVALHASTAPAAPRAAVPPAASPAPPAVASHAPTAHPLAPPTADHASGPVLDATFDPPPGTTPNVAFAPPVLAAPGASVSSTATGATAAEVTASDAAMPSSALPSPAVTASTASTLPPPGLAAAGPHADDAGPGGFAPPTLDPPGLPPPAAS